MVTSTELSSTSPSAKSRRGTQFLSPLLNAKYAGEQEPQLPQLPPPPSLSFSEPSLRFPRPQGNEILAHWISKSDPDIMHLNSAPVEESGLSESTYELIGCTDTESQDDNYTDNISESVASLEIHRPDDVISLAGTEHTCDEESVGEGADDRGHYQPTREPSLDLHRQANNPDIHLDDCDDGNSSRASMEYTNYSLQSPSLLTPEASRYMVLPTNESKHSMVHKWLSLSETGSRSIRSVRRSCLIVIPGVLLVFGAVFLATAMFSLAQQESQPILSKVVSSKMSQPLSSHHTTHSHGINTATTGSLSSPTSGVALIPMPNSQDEGLFRSGKPTISFMPHGKNDVLINFGRDVRDIWLAKNCFHVTVMRSSQKLDFTLASDHDGILVKFPRRETYGVVNLYVRSSCRPRTEKAVKVHFNKGIIVDALEKTKSLAQDLSDLVPVAAHEAERRLAGARKIIGSASESFAHAWLHATESVQEFTINQRLGVKNSLVSTACQFWQQALGAFDERLTITNAHFIYVNAMRSAQARLQLGILDAQVSARLWWLKIQGKDDEYRSYASKARIYLEHKVLAAENLLRNVRKGKPEAVVRA